MARVRDLFSFCFPMLGLSFQSCGWRCRFASPTLPLCFAAVALCVKGHGFESQSVHKFFGVQFFASVPSSMYGAKGPGFKTHSVHKKFFLYSFFPSLFNAGRESSDRHSMRVYSRVHILYTMTRTYVHMSRIICSFLRPVSIFL